MANTNIRKSTKTATIVTYSIALVCLLAGFFAPLYGVVGSSSIEQSMLAFYLPDALNKALGTQLITGEFVANHAFTDAPFTVFKLDVNVAAWTLLLYAVVTLVGLFMLIPVICGKKGKKTSAVCAYVIEILAALAITLYLICVLRFYIGGDFIYYNILIALGGTLLMLVIQSILNKGKLGTMKLVLFILSAICLLCLFPLSMWITALADPFESFAGSIGAVDGFSNYPLFVFGYKGIDLAFKPNYTLNLISAAPTYEKILIISVIITSIMVVLNLLIDLLGLCTGSAYGKNGVRNANAGSKIFGLIRYIVQLIAAGMTIIALLLLKRDSGAKIGLYLYLITIVSLILVIIAIVRVARIKKIKSQAKAEERLHFSDGELEKEYSEDLEVVSDVPAEQTEEVAVAPVAEETAAAPVAETAVEETVEPDKTEEVAVVPVTEETVEENEQAAPATTEYVSEEIDEDEQLEIAVEDTIKEETHTIVYNLKTIYNGPSDEFMDTLTDEEKVEFAKVFIEKSKCALPRIPDYEIGGHNDDFFPAIFIYLNKFRSILSSNLLAKIYKHINSVK